MIRSLILAAALLAFGASAAAAQEHPASSRKRPSPERIVRVGDLVEHAGVIAKVPIFPRARSRRHRHRVRRTR